MAAMCGSFSLTMSSVGWKVIGRRASCAVAPCRLASAASPNSGSNEARYEATAKLAKHYTNAALGDVTMRTKGKTVTFDVGEWQSAVASRRNDDGSTALVTIAPGVSGFEFVVPEGLGKRALVVRDAQHEYVFTETP